MKFKVNWENSFTKSWSNNYSRSKNWIEGNAVSWLNEDWTYRWTSTLFIASYVRVGSRSTVRSYCWSRSL